MARNRPWQGDVWFDWKLKKPGGAKEEWEEMKQELGFIAASTLPTIEEERQQQRACFTIQSNKGKGERVAGYRP